MRAINFRSCPPGETFDKVSPFLRQLGITRISKQTGLDKIGIPVWCAYTPNAKAIVIAQGKGADDESAKTSALMEAVERVIATQPACEIVTEPRAELIAQGQAVHSLNCLLATGHDPISDTETIEWTSATDLVSGGTCWLPYRAICFDRTQINPRFWLSTDGLASGNNKEEAILHGLLERVERDAMALWAVAPQNQRFAKRISLNIFEDDANVQMLRMIHDAGLEIALFDISSDLEIPCFIALLGPRRPYQGQLRHVDITLGAGASPFPVTAASRAISEAAQSRMTFIAGARDDLVPETYTRAADPALLKAFEASADTHDFKLPIESIKNTEDALEKVTAHLKAYKIDQLYAIDLTPDWLPVSVVKVVTPQLENPDGDRRIRIGTRALLRSLQ